MALPVCLMLLLGVWMLGAASLHATRDLLALSVINMDTSMAAHQAQLHLQSAEQALLLSEYPEAVRGPDFEIERLTLAPDARVPVAAAYRITVTGRWHQAYAIQQADYRVSPCVPMSEASPCRPQVKRIAWRPLARE